VYREHVSHLSPGQLAPQVSVISCMPLLLYLLVVLIKYWSIDWLIDWLHIWVGLHAHIKWNCDLLRVERRHTEISDWNEVQHQRPGQRRVERRELCDALQRSLVVQTLHRRQQSERPLQARPLAFRRLRHLVRQEPERLVLLAEIHRDEDSSIQRPLSLTSTRGQSHAGTRWHWLYAEGEVIKFWMEINWYRCW